MRYIKLFEQFDEFDPFGEEISPNKQNGLIILPMDDEIFGYDLDVLDEYKVFKIEFCDAIIDNSLAILQIINNRNRYEFNRLLNTIIDSKSNIEFIENRENFRRFFQIFDVEKLNDLFRRI